MVIEYQNRKKKKNQRWGWIPLWKASFSPFKANSYLGKGENKMEGDG